MDIKNDRGREKQMDIIKFKPFLCDFIRYYYEDLENLTGGHLHIATDDGNLTEQDIWYCQDRCKFHNDDFGYFIATLMRHFTEDELEEMYENYWGMKRNVSL